ncbi:purine-cytosine permease family protein [Raoultella planticola]|uniref:purine-cytosine permease family protein n=1 Tax=Raoultella planticola TaxID=575 RepID=UPI00045B8027|nr:cytosine permease [Raoultella planticola]MDU4422441.1 cytosine permease [Raoultella sp.]EKW5591063.1 cytosine permease [Raoultella planticola]ELU0692451.1 cytosine permease [Raoultella planticola]KAJ95782.1 sulfonate ABC transporter substrate-binding protein [Raoultella planticola]HED2412375.1 cytosine permease [Raoultella planticola]
MTESRSIDYIPDHERHGHPFSQFTLWFGGNLQITAIVTGALAVVLGGDVVWSLIGLLVGQVLGAAVMSLHALQGPRLGLPQMIISRAQFGVFGAVVPLVLVCVMYVGFSASGTVLAGQAMARLLSISDVAGMLLFSTIIIVIAVLGYRVIHKLGKVASVVGVLAFVYLFVTLLLSANLPAIAQNNHFSLPMFLLAVSLSSSWQIAFCPYVSDYSRYLPRNVSGAKTFLCVFSGTVLGTQASMTLGVLTAAIAGSAFSGHEVSFIVGLGKSQLMAMVIYFAICFGKITFTTLNAYGSFMSLSTIVSGFRRQAALSKRARILFVVLMVAISCVIALLSEPAFLKNFTHFLLFLLAFFVPWSAIGLTDYYLISAGAVDIPALSDPQQRYGYWNLYAIAVYIVGVLIQLPFIENPLYHGSLTWLFAGNDVSWIIGWFGTGVLYYALRRFDRRVLPTQSVFPD